MELPKRNKMPVMYSLIQDVILKYVKKKNHPMSSSKLGDSVVLKCMERKI